MKACSFAILVALFVLASCARRTYSDTELRSLMIGSWNTTTLFETNTPGTRIVTKSTGMTTFTGDGTMKSEYDALMTISITDGQLPVEYHAVVHGNWSVSGERLRTSRTSEEITAKDQVSRNFLEREEMKKLRSQAPTESFYSLTVSRRKVIALDSHGGQTTYTRGQ